MLRNALVFAFQSHRFYLLSKRACQPQKIANVINKLRPSDQIIPDAFPFSPPYAEPFEELKAGQNEDIAEFVDNLTPPLPVAFNLAAYVNKSDSLKKLVDLGVDLSQIELKPQYANFILGLDFEKHMKKHIQFLHDVGVPADELGRFITRNPLIFKDEIENLKIRMNYFLSKHFSKESIARIVTCVPPVLSMTTLEVDSRLGFLQKQFQLHGDEVRYLITKCPKLITQKFDKIREKLFVIKEELGYSAKEMKKLLLAKPKVYLIGNRSLKERFDILHNIMGLSHDKILEFPGALLCRGFILKQRHQYLVHLNRAQYDPTLPLYVSLYDLVSTSDAEFCSKCAKTSIDRYNEFLKTL